MKIKMCGEHGGADWHVSRYDAPSLDLPDAKAKHEHEHEHEHEQSGNRGDEKYQRHSIWNAQWEIRINKIQIQLYYHCTEYKHWGSNSRHRSFGKTLEMQ